MGGGGVLDRLNVYIDESGDEGFSIAEQVGGQGSSRWFVVAAVIVRSDRDRNVAESVNRIKSRLGKDVSSQKGKPLHWTKLRHPQRHVVLEEVKNEEFSWIGVALEKLKLDPTKFDSHLTRKKNSNVGCPLYHYALRLLFERLMFPAKEAGMQLDITLENRASLSIADVYKYAYLLSVLPGPFGHPTLDTDWITEIRAVNKGDRKLLQLSDACAGALFNALEPNKFGMIDAVYLEKLAHKLVRRDDKLWGYGLKLFPKNWQDCVSRNRQYEWMKNL